MMNCNHHSVNDYFSNKKGCNYVKSTFVSAQNNELTHDIIEIKGSTLKIGEFSVNKHNVLKPVHAVTFIICEDTLHLCSYVYISVFKGNYILVS